MKVDRGVHGSTPLVSAALPAEIYRFKNSVTFSPLMKRSSLELAIMSSCSSGCSEVTDIVALKSGDTCMTRLNFAGVYRHTKIESPYLWLWRPQAVRTKRLQRHPALTILKLGFMEYVCTVS